MVKTKNPAILEDQEFMEKKETKGFGTNGEPGVRGARGLKGDPGKLGLQGV